MSELAAVLTRSMQASAGDLMVLDRETSLWCRHPWPEVHGLAESVAAWLLDHDRPAAVGLVGEPTVELVAAIQECLACRRCRVDPARAGTWRQ